MVTIDCPPQILVVSDNRKGLISNAGGGGGQRRPQLSDIEGGLRATTFRKIWGSGGSPPEIHRIC